MIHKTAVIDNKAKIDTNVEIGPYTVIGPNVEILEGTKIQSHVNITGFTKIGKNNKIFPFASIGNEPQDLKYKGENTSLLLVTQIQLGNIRHKYWYNWWRWSNKNR